MGCSLIASALPSSLGISRASARARSNVRVRVTLGSPRVRVPVLSKTTRVTACAVSSGAPPLIRMPILAPRPVPTITAVGVARPSAHGHAMTSTVTANKNANKKSPSRSVHELGSASSVAAQNHAIHATVAMATTPGTKTPLTRSAYAWIGALRTCASS